MLHAFGNDVHFPGSERDGLVPELERHGALENDEDFVGVRVRMPDKLALQLDELELVVIHFGNDAGRPVFREPGELVLEIDRTVGHCAPDHALSFTYCGVTLRISPGSASSACVSR